MRLPEKIVEAIRAEVWREADKIAWNSLTDHEKSRHYERWIRDKGVGGLLERYIERGSIRVYLKDTIMKPYPREKLKDPAPILACLGVSDQPVVEEYIKPHGRLLDDGRVVCWGNARDWKSVLFAVYERAFEGPRAHAFAAVLLFPTGKFREREHQAMVREASTRLLIEQVRWLEP